MPDLPAGLPQPKAEIRLLAVDEEALVHEPGTLERLPPRDHERARSPVARNLVPVLFEVELALGQPADRDRPAFGSEGVAKCAQRIREPADRRVDLALRRQLNDSGEADLGSLVQDSNELLEGSRLDLGIGIEKECVAGIRRHQSTVVRVCEAVILGWDDSSPWKLRNHGSSVVGAFVVDDDEIEQTVALLGEDRAQAGAKPSCLARRDHDYGEVIHGDGRSSVRGRERSAPPPPRRPGRCAV